MSEAKLPILDFDPMGLGAQTWRGLTLANVEATEEMPFVHPI